ncbi:hypothetical protein AB1N83_010956 [Pleurotus pulmonarius]
MSFKVTTLVFSVFLFAILSNGAKLNLDATSACNCKVKVGNETLGNTYDAGEVAKVLKRGQDLQKRGHTIGAGKYPHPFGNGEGLTFPNSCKAGGLMEFVILPKGGASRDAEQERVVWDAKGKFCGCITHNGAGGNSFRRASSLIVRAPLPVRYLAYPFGIYSHFQVSKNCFSGKLTDSIFSYVVLASTNAAVRAALLRPLSIPYIVPEMRLTFRSESLLFLLAVFVTLVHGASLNIDATRDCDCKVVVDGKTIGNTYTSGQVDTALKRGQDLQKKGQTLGGNDYPHTFGNKEKLVFPNSCKGDLSEFVIVKKGGASRDPETDRVVWDSKGKFCGCMTHNGVAGNSFQVCK